RPAWSAATGLRWFRFRWPSPPPGLHTPATSPAQTLRNTPRHPTLVKMDDTHPGQRPPLSGSPIGAGPSEPRPRTDSGAPPTADNVEQRRSSSYQLAFEDLRFLRREDMRSVRFQLEYAKADQLLRDWGI